MPKAKPKDTRNPIDVVCSKCNASVGQPCTATIDGRNLTRYHRERIKAANAKDETKWTSFADDRGIQYRKIKQGKRERLQYRARVLVKVDGNRKELTRIAWTVSDARNAKVDLINESKAAPPPEPPPSPRSETITFAELADEFEATLQPTTYNDPHSDDRRKIKGTIAPKSIQDAKRALSVFKAKWGSTLAKEITKPDVQAWKLERFQVPKQRGGGRRSVANVNHELRTLRALFSYAIDKYDFAKNPVRGLIQQKDENVRDRYLLFWEIKALLAAADESLQPFLIFMLATAARSGETLHVERRDVDLDSGIVTLRRPITKNQKRSRELPITPDLHKALVQRLSEMSNDPHARLFDKTYYSYECALQNAITAAGLKDVHLHDMRRTWITYAIPSGISLPDAMKISDHYQEKTFLRYFQQTHESHRVNAARYDTFWQQGMIEAATQSRMLAAVN